MVRYWISHGVKIFRVDNPHTKPPNFWAWLIGKVKDESPPDVLFLSEAFTRPVRLYGLAKLGFTQSYSYFTWRTAKWELTEFGEEIAKYADCARPNLFVNTPPTSCTNHCSTAAPPGCSPSGPRWPPRSAGVGGVLRLRTLRTRSGTRRQRGVPELREVRAEATRFRGGRSPRGRSLEPFLTRLNEIRRLHPALAQMRTIKFHHIDNDALLAYSKFDPISGDCVLVVVTLNAFGPEESTLWLDMEALGMEAYERFWVRDEITGEEYQWGQSNYVRLDPVRTVAHVINMPLIPHDARMTLLRRE